MIKCKECEYCNQSGRQNSNRYTTGRKHYWCKHPLINDMNNEVFGNKAEGFIGFEEK